MRTEHSRLGLVGSRGHVTGSLKIGALNKSQSGFTLLELIVFIVVVSIALAGLLGVFNRAASNSIDPLVQIRALECAQAKMDEILARKFDNNTPSGGLPACGSADLGAVACLGIIAGGALNDVGDYNGHTDNTLDQCQISVSVSAAGADIGLANALARRIIVTVNSDGGGSAVISAYRANF